MSIICQINSEITVRFHDFFIQIGSLPKLPKWYFWGGGLTTKCKLAVYPNYQSGILGGGVNYQMQIGSLPKLPKWYLGVGGKLPIAIPTTTNTISHVRKQSCKYWLQA